MPFSDYVVPGKTGVINHDPGSIMMRFGRDRIARIIEKEYSPKDGWYILGVGNYGVALTKDDINTVVKFTSEWEEFEKAEEAADKQLQLQHFNFPIKGTVVKRNHTGTFVAKYELEKLTPLSDDEQIEIDDFVVCDVIHRLAKAAKIRTVRKSTLDMAWDGLLKKHNFQRMDTLPEHLYHFVRGVLKEAQQLPFDLEWCDLHAGNILKRPDGTYAFIDI